MTERLTADRLLRAVSRFDAGSVPDIATALHRPLPNQQRSVWVQLKKLVAAGLVSRIEERGCPIRYAITEAGRAAIREAA